eukprot:8001657-Lingulodinium_polyedra.AAC.1
MHHGGGAGHRERAGPVRREGLGPRADGWTCRALATAWLGPWVGLGRRGTRSGSAGRDPGLVFRCVVFRGGGSDDAW